MFLSIRIHGTIFFCSTVAIYHALIFNLQNQNENKQTSLKRYERQAASKSGQIIRSRINNSIRFSIFRLLYNIFLYTQLQDKNQCWITLGWNHLPNNRAKLAHKLAHELQYSLVNFIHKCYFFSFVFEVIFISLLWIHCHNNIFFIHSASFLDFSVINKLVNEI